MTSRSCISFLFIAAVLAPLYSNNVDMGKGSYGSPNVVSWGEGKKCIIGKYCSLASGITILLGGNHRIDWITTYPFPSFRNSAAHIRDFVATKGDVIIGNDVWIGDGAFILSGVTIGDGAVIAARAVVSKNVPPYAVVAGNPARVIKYRFDDIIIQKLLQIAWWDWDDHQIDRAMEFLLSNDVTLFIRYCEANKLLHETRSN